MSALAFLSGRQLANVGIRAFSLAAKLGLTLYMGRYLGLADLGLYGLVFGSVMVLSEFLGLRYDYIIARQIVAQPAEATLAAMQDQAAFMLGNYLLLALGMLLFGYAAKLAPEGQVLAVIFVLSVLENLASITQTNMTSLGRPVLANFLFFIRAASWVFPVIALGLLFPSERSVSVVFYCWIAGVGASLALALWFWRNLPWSTLRHQPVRWARIWSGVRQTFYVWLGTLCLALGMYVDRFMVARLLDMEKAGIAAFYFSFAFALLTLAQSGVLAFAYPQLIRLHREGNLAAFKKEAWQAGLHTAIFTALVAVALALGVPMIGALFHRPELAQEAPTLWGLLAGMCLRSSAETLYYVLFARHQDRAIWLGNILYLAPSCLGNAFFIPHFGLVGIGYSAVLSGLFLLGWRGWFVWRYESDKLRLPAAR